MPEGNFYEFICLYFGLDPAPLISTKLFKVQISLIRRLNIRVIVYMDGLVRSEQDLIFHWDMVIYLLQNVRFVLNSKDSVLDNRLGQNRSFRTTSKNCKVDYPTQKNLQDQGNINYGPQLWLGKLGATVQTILSVKILVRSLSVTKSILWRFQAHVKQNCCQSRSFSGG